MSNFVLHTILLGHCGIQLRKRKGKSMTIKIAALIFSLSILISFWDTAVAANIRPYIHGSGSYRAIVIEGEIEPGDFKAFVQIIRENQSEISDVYIFSSGGDFYEAMKIGRAIRTLELSSQVPMRGPSGQPLCKDDGLGVTPIPNNLKNCTCASACFFIHIGGVHRGGTFLAVHRPFFGKGKFGKLSQADARKAFDELQQSARDYMVEMGVPKHIQEDLLGTPSDKALILDEKIVKKHFWLKIPYRHEWIRNICGRLSVSEFAELDSYYNRLIKAGYSFKVAFSSEEEDRMKALMAKKEPESKCEIEVVKQGRFDAYTKYFGTKPTDHGNHNFTKWTQAQKYLGKRFYDLLSEERFEEEKFGGTNFLERAATANAPHISLSDSQSKPKVVTWVSFTSTPNPSATFTQRLVKYLEDAWGKSSGSNGTTEWRWNKKEFSAMLELNPASANGSFLSLVIEEK